MLPSAASSNLAAAAEVKPGQTAIGIAADRSAVTGMITKVDAEGITVSIATLPPGAAVSNLSGTVIGISRGTGVFIPAQVVNDLLTAPSS